MEKPVLHVQTTLDESVLHRLLQQIEELRTSPRTAGLDLCYGAVVELQLDPELLESDEPVRQRCHVRAGGWIPDASQASKQKGLQA